MENHLKIFLFYDIAYKTPYGAEPLPIIFGKIDRYITKYDGNKYLWLFHFNEKYK